MEKLIVKNFGPIKDIELDIKKINILIGEQGSGKSTLAKLICGLLDIDIFFNTFLTNDSKILINEFNIILKKYKIDTFVNQETQIIYTNNIYNFNLSKNKLIIKILDAEFNNFKKMIPNIPSLKGINYSFIKKYLSEDFLTDNVICTYIPTERLIVPFLSANPFTNFSKSVELNDYVSIFAEIYINSRKEVNELDINWLNSSYSFKNDVEYLKVNKSKEIEFEYASTGYHSLIPLLIVLKKVSIKKNARIVIEEPEQNLYPSSQYNLVKNIIELSQIYSNSKNKKLEKNQSLFFTTHSPYILSSLNNLMYAYNIGKKNKKVTEVVNKKYWVNPADVSAYMLYADGRCENIMDSELNQIDVSKIDSVSKEINEEYDKILNLEFDNV